MLIINLVGLLLIALIIWWFWLYQPKDSAMSSDKRLITVENGVYTPAQIKVHANKAVMVEFIRKDPSPSAETVYFEGLNISESLPLNKIKTIRLPAMPAGEYEFHCQLKMIRGRITAR